MFPLKDSKSIGSADLQSKSGSLFIKFFQSILKYYTKIKFYHQKLIISVSNFPKMGATESFTQNEEFMKRFYRKEKDFLKQYPLYETEQISFPLSTSGMKIVDQTGRRVKLAGVNWSGGHAQRHSVGGLDCRDLRQLCRMIRQDLGFNTVRLTFSLQMYFDNNVVDFNLLKANPALKGKTSMQIFDTTIKQLTDAGIMVYLNNHTSKSQWCCSNSDGDGLWWSKEYSESKFFECLKALAHRYKNNKLVIGMDLRNEIRKANGLTPTWGDENPETDWRMAAQKIGNQILQIAPHWLIIIGGLFYQMDLTGVYNYPIKLKIPNKLVYSGHLYSFSWPTWVAFLWRISTYQSFYQKVFDQQLFVRGLGVPFILGEFGNNCSDTYWQYIIKLLLESDIDWTYWCLDGYKCINQQDQTYGILTKDFISQRYPEMFKQLSTCAKPKKRQGGLLV